MTTSKAPGKFRRPGFPRKRPGGGLAIVTAVALTLGLALGPAALPAAAAPQDPPRPELTPELTAELLTDPRGESTPATEPPISGLVVKYAPGVVVPLSADAPVPGAAAAGADLSPGDPVGLGWYEADLAEPVDAATAQEIAERLMADPAIEYAEPQFWVRPAAATPSPNDPLWNRQWGFASYGDDTFSYPGTFPATPLDRQTTGTNLVEALEAPRGDTPTVAVIDFGVTNHPDLAGRVTSGYNFISDPVIAGNGYGRGPDYSDPGSWVSAAMASELPLSMVPCAAPKATLWHGTHVTGTIAAITDNALGVAGSLPVEIQMLRALGTCDLGTYGDIGAAMLWAAGGTVPGVPANPSPARVVNMSLGASIGYCPQFWQDAINYGTARGTVYVAAAGNSNGEAAEFAPANCAGVIAVAATDPYGGRAAFSDYGSYVDVAAPGVGIVSTYDSGLTSPQTPDYAAVGGTSMAAPHVTAAVAMLLAAEPDLTPAQVTERVRATATPFKQTANFGENGAPMGDPAYDCFGDDSCGAGYLNMAALMGQATADAPVVAPRYQVRNGEVVVSGAGAGGAGGAGAGGAGAGAGADDVAPLASEVTVRFTFEPPAGAPDDYEYTVSRGVEVLANGTTTETDVSVTVPGGSRDEFTVLITPRTGGVPGVAAQAMRVPSVEGSVPAAPTITAVSTSETYAVIGVMNSFAVPNATSTRVTAQPGGAQCEIGAGTGSLSACSVSGLEPGTEYTFTAVSSNTFGDSAQSAPVTATPQYGEGPTDPIIDSIVTQGSTATISWQPAQAGPGRSIQLYVVRAFVDGELDPWAYCAAVGRWGEPEVNSCQLGNLVFGKAYEFVVIAQDNEGYASYSNFSDPVLPVGQPSPPTALTDPPVVVMGDGTATLAPTTTWEPLNGGAPILGVRFVASPGGASCDIPWDDTVFAGACDITGLTNGQEYTFRALVYNEMGASPLTDATVPLTPGVPVPAGELVVLDEPVRVLDTRDNGGGPVVPGTPVTVDVAAPDGSIAVAYNLTITGTTGSGYATVYPSGEDLPDTSVSNWSSSNQTVANGYVTGLGAGGEVDVAVAGTAAHAILDIIGYYAPPVVGGVVTMDPPPAATGRLLPMTPARAYDSRTDVGPLSGGDSRTIDLSAQVPVGATAVAYTLTETGTTNTGYLAVGLPDLPEPGTSVLNWTGPNQTIANSSTAAINPDRQIEVFAGGSGSAQFIVDVIGYYAPTSITPDGLLFTPITPARAYDSRVDQPGGPLAGGENRTTSITVPGLPDGVPAIAANLTATGTTASGWLALTPGGTKAPPGISTLNWTAPNTTIANGTTIGASNNTLTTYADTRGTTEYILDIAGYYHRPRQ